MAEESKPPFFQVEVGTSLVKGESYELVLRDGTYTNPISRLIWPTPPSATFDVSVTHSWTPWTSITMALRSAWPLEVGTMVDEDWKADTLKYGKSQHEAYLKVWTSARVEQGFHFRPLTLSLGGLYRWTSWEGWNGTGTYENTDGTTDKITFSGLLIAYRQQWLIPYLGASWTLAAPGWTLTPGLRLGPYAWCFDMDNHNYANRITRTFLDATRGGIYGQGSLEATLEGGSDWSWGLRASWEIQWGAIGDTWTTYSYQSETGHSLSYGKTTNSAGTWFHEAGLTVFVRN